MRMFVVAVRMRSHELDLCSWFCFEGGGGGGGRSVIEIQLTISPFFYQIQYSECTFNKSTKVTGICMEEWWRETPQKDTNRLHGFLFLCVCFDQGECLITVATGEVSDREAERAGLVTIHAYAVLDIQHVKVRSCTLWLPSNNFRWLNAVKETKIVFFRTRQQWRKKFLTAHSDRRIFLGYLAALARL